MSEPVIEWRDLVALRPLEIARELCLPLPWLLVALLAPHPAVTIVASGILFMTGLRVTHNAFHRTLGVSRRVGDLVMFVLSVLLGGAMHAIEYTHLRHHAHCLEDSDVEGRIARFGFARAMWHSATYPLLIHCAALMHGSRRQRSWVAIELIAVATLHAWVWIVSANAIAQTIVLSLYFANANAAMVGIWAVHRGGDALHPIARTSRSRWVNRLVVNMFHHWEHHLHPAVPTCHLPELALRLDAARRGLPAPLQVFEVARAG